MVLQKSVIILKHTGVYHDVNKPLPLLLASVLSSATLIGTVVIGEMLKADSSVRDVNYGHTYVV